MDSREAFKFGFLYRCAEEGLGVDEAMVRAARGMQKAALFDFSGFKNLTEGGSKIMGGIGGLANIAGNIGTTGLALGALGSAGIGAGTGLALARMREDELDPGDIKKEEIIDAYRRAAEEAEQRKLLNAKLGLGGDKSHFRM